MYNMYHLKIVVWCTDYYLFFQVIKINVHKNKAYLKHKTSFMIF